MLIISMLFTFFIISFYFASVLRFSVLLAVKTCSVLPPFYRFLPLLFLVILSWSWRPDSPTLCCLDFARNINMIAHCLEKILRSINGLWLHPSPLSPMAVSQWWLLLRHNISQITELFPTSSFPANVFPSFTRRKHGST